MNLIYLGLELSHTCFKFVIVLDTSKVSFSFMLLVCCPRGPLGKSQMRRPTKDGMANESLNLDLH